jgi:hypothetical protein
MGSKTVATAEVSAQPIPLSAIIHQYHRALPSPGRLPARTVLDA